MHIVTLVPCSQELIVNATLSNGHVGIGVVLDAATGPAYLEPDLPRT